MKKYFYLAFLITSFAISQEKEKYDYFVNINTHQLSQKMDLETFFDHEIFESKVKNDEKVKWNEFISFVDKSKPLTIHGNYSDSIKYFQITLPIVDANKFERYIQNKIDQENEGDSIVNEIKKFEKYNIYNSMNDSFTVAWNEKNVVFYQVLDFGRNSLSTNYYQSLEENMEYEISTEEVFPPEEAPIIIQKIEIEEPEIESTEEVEVVKEYYEMSEEERKQEMIEEAVVRALLNNSYEDYDYEEDFDFKNIIKEQREQKQQFQEEQIASMFENGLKAPSFDKLNLKADVSAWVNYESVFSNIGNIYRGFGSLGLLNENPKNDASIVGMNFDLFFENDKARMEQITEYSSDFGHIMQKMVSRKPNAQIFKYFPKQEPLGYLSYHFNTEEMLNNYPKIMKQVMSSVYVDSKDSEIVLDLMNTIIDEKSTATLFDGDISMFFHSVEPYEYTYLSETYNDDYELVEEEKTITKTMPIFTVIFTSSHPTMSQKLLDLGIRKNVLTEENGIYSIKGNKEFGGFSIFKKDDIIVFSNGLEYLNANATSTFSKSVKNEMSKNYFYANFNIQDFLTSLELNQEFKNESAKLLEFKNQFRNISMKSSKKISNNKMKLEMEMQSNFSDKNIIIQLLDVLNFQ